MRVFLTGSTGYMGSVVLERLLDKGIAVLALARPERKGVLGAKAGLDWVFGELDDEALVGKAAASADAVLHLAAQHDATMERLDAAAVRAISAALKGSGKAFITTSASPVYGNTGFSPRDESEPVIDPFPMRRFRLEHDRLVIGLRDMGVRSIVIRPPFVYGRAGGFLVTLIQQALADRDARTIGSGANGWSTVHVEDLADLYLRVLLTDTALGAYNAGSVDVVSMREIAETIAQGFGPGITVGSWTEEEAVARLGLLMPIMALEQRISSQRAYRELGWAPRTSGLLSDLAEGSYRQMPLVSYSH